MFGIGPLPLVGRAQYATPLGGARTTARRRLGSAAHRRADAGKIVRILVSRATCRAAPASRCHRSDEDGKRTPGAARRHGRRGARAGRTVGRGRHAARDHHALVSTCHCFPGSAASGFVRYVGIGVGEHHRHPARSRSSSLFASISARRCAGWRSDRDPSSSSGPIHIGGLSIRVCARAVRGRRLLHRGVERRTIGRSSSRRSCRSHSTGRKAFQRRPEFIITSVEMTDWQMLVEKWARRQTTSSAIRSNTARPPGPPRFTTTVKYAARVQRGQFAYEDHETPWSIVAPNIDINISNRPRLQRRRDVPRRPRQRPELRADVGRLQGAVPHRRPKLSRSIAIEMTTDGARQPRARAVSISTHWPEQTYQVQSRVQFPAHARALLRERDVAARAATGIRRDVPSVQGRPRSRRRLHESDVAGAVRLPIPGALRLAALESQGLRGHQRRRRSSLGGNAKFTFGIAPLGEPTKPTGRFDASYTNVDLRAVHRLLSSSPACASPAAPPGATCSSGRWAASREHRGGGQSPWSPPAGRRDRWWRRSTRRARPTRIIRGTSGGRSAPLPLPAHLPIAGAA